MKKLVSAIYDDWYPFYEILPKEAKHCDANEVLKVSADPTDLDTDSVLLLWGGGDISPSLYNAAPSRRGYGSVEPNRRDRIEWALLQRAIEIGIPIVGVCRGAQMLCAAAGGKLIQHLDNHAGANHEIITVDGEVMQVNSLHHQMMYPWEVDHRLLAWSKEKLSNEYHDEDKILNEIPCEPELVVFPKIKGIAAQWHPEAMHSTTPASQYLLKTIKEVMDGSI